MAKKRSNKEPAQGGIEQEAEKLKRDLTAEANKAIAETKKSGEDAAKLASERADSLMQTITRETEGFVNRIFKAIEKGAHAIVEKTGEPAARSRSATRSTSAGKSQAGNKRAAKRPASRGAAAKKAPTKKVAAKKAPKKAAAKKAPARKKSG